VLDPGEEEGERLAAGKAVPVKIGPYGGRDSGMKGEDDNNDDNDDVLTQDISVTVEAVIVVMMDVITEVMTEISVTVNCDEEQGHKLEEAVGNVGKKNEELAGNGGRDDGLP